MRRNGLSSFFLKLLQKFFFSIIDEGEKWF
jgi:hypothetical protein